MLLKFPPLFSVATFSVNFWLVCKQRKINEKICCQVVDKKKSANFSRIFWSLFQKSIENHGFEMTSKVPNKSQLSSSSAAAWMERLRAKASTYRYIPAVQTSFGHEFIIKTSRSQKWRKNSSKFVYILAKQCRSHYNLTNFFGKNFKILISWFSI